MPFFVIAYPAFDPVLVSIGPFPIRWYALAYIAGLLLGLLYARALVMREGLWGGAPHPTRASLEDLVVYAALGVVLGGRLGYVLFYNLPYYVSEPAEIIAVWKGGMSFHGGLAGATLGIVVFARRFKTSALGVADLCAAAAPIGIGLGRVANFIKPELWGRITDAPWGVVFPGAGASARHPSQLYEAGLEGVALLAVLWAAVRLGALGRPGLVTGLFGIGYGVARTICEFFREPDPQLGFLFGGATMGMLLSLPLIIMGAVFVANAARRMPAAA